MKVRLLIIATLLVAIGSAVAIPVTAGAGDPLTEGPTVQPWDGVLERGSIVIDASPQEAPGEAWAVSRTGLIYRFDGSFWTEMPTPLDAEGTPVANLTPASGQLAARATPDGAVALLADQRLFVRDPGGLFHVAGTATAAVGGSSMAPEASPHAISPAVALPAPVAEASAVPPAAAPEEEAPVTEEAPAAAEAEEAPAEEAAADGEAFPTYAPEPLGEEASPTYPSPPVEEEPVPTAARSEALVPVAPRQAATEPSPTEPPLEPGEQLYDTPLVAAIAEAGRAGAFVVPTAGADGVRDAVLHFDAAVGWSREPICLGVAPTCTTPPATFSVRAIDATGTQNAWLLATGTDPAAGVVLIHRVVEAGGAVWRPVTLGSPFEEAAPTIPGATVKITARAAGQPLVVTTAGVWADAKVSAGASTADATIYYDLGAGAVTGSWCDLQGTAAALCAYPLGSALGNGRTFAWADGSTFGRRIILGASQGSLLRLTGSTFERLPGGGRATAFEGGGAFSSPEEGWIGAGGGLVRYGGAPAPDRLRPWPVPFRHPLTAIAAEPGVPVGAIGSEALAVGDQGEVARYLPGIGWSPETLLGATGKAATPRLRGVAWPTAEEAFAVGDAGEMWRWRKATGLWESDPAKPGTADVAVANFTGIAFDPADPDRGYAVGKQGVLLGYGRQWSQEPLPEGMSRANFTSIAFSGGEAIATYKIPVSEAGREGYEVGILVEGGSGWHQDEAFAAALPGEESSLLIGLKTTPELVAGLPDGGAIVATPTELLERDARGGAWHRGGPLPGFPVALAAVREGGALRAIVSVEAEPSSARLSKLFSIDLEAVQTIPTPGQAPVLTDPYPLPVGGAVVRQTATGWEDQQHAAWPEASESNAQAFDQAQQPDATLAMLTDGEGRFGWAVGGDSTLQTATVDRYPDDGQAAPGSAGAPLRTRPGWAAFAIGGGAECLGPCADLGPTGAGPWRWLPAAVRRAGEAAGVKAFINTGGGTAGPSRTDNFAHEEVGAAARLTLGAGALSVYQAPASTDRDTSGSLEQFLTAFGSASAPLGSRPVGAGIAPVSSSGAGRGYYAFDATAGTGRVRVVVLDTSSGSLGGEQRCWLAGELEGAAASGIPAIAVGNAAITKLADAALAAPVLVSGSAPECGSAASAGASAYFFDEPEQNRESALRAGGESIPAYGSGSLGYTGRTQNFSIKPNSGFLIVEVDPTPAHRGAMNRAPVAVRLIPNISELALDATDGTLLRRSQIAFFEGLARRPQSGLGCREFPACETVPTDPYTPIPSRCIGSTCVGRLEPEYRFTSSAPDIADFVAHDPTAADPRRLKLDSSGKPIPDPDSGILCAYNAGTTTVRVEAGGLSYSMLVTVQPGRVRRPCGTVPLRNPPQPAQAVGLPPLEFPEPEPLPREPKPELPVPPVPSTPAPVVSHPSGPPPPPPKAPAPPKLPQQAVPIPLFQPPTNIAPLAVIVPPPPPPAAQPTPPSGTSPVTQPVTSPNPEDEEEAATEMAHHAVAHRDLVGPGHAYASGRHRPRVSLAPATTPGSGPTLGPPLVLALMIALSSLAGAGLLARRRQAPLATESLRRYQ